MKPQDILDQILDYPGWEGTKRDSRSIDISKPFSGEVLSALERARILLSIRRDIRKIPHPFCDDVIQYDQKEVRYAFGFAEIKSYSSKEWLYMPLKEAALKLGITPKRDLTYWRRNPNRQYNDYFASDIHAFEYQEGCDFLVSRCSESHEIVLADDEHPAWPPRNRRCKRCREQEFIEHYNSDWKRLIDCADTRRPSKSPEYPQY